MKYKLAVFDFDGTLADTFPWFTAVLNEVAERFDFKRVEAAEVELLRGADSRTIIKHLQVPMWKMPMIATHMRALAARDIDRLSLYEGITHGLQHLAESGVTLGIVSSNSVGNIQRVLGPTSVGRIAHFECGASMFGKASKLKRVLRKSGILASEAIYVGDEIRDAHAAREVGMAFGAVSWGYNRVDALRAQSPDELFVSAADLAEKIAGTRQA